MSTLLPSTLTNLCLFSTDIHGKAHTRTHIASEQEKPFSSLWNLFHQKWKNKQQHTLPRSKIRGGKRPATAAASASALTTHKTNKPKNVHFHFLVAHQTFTQLGIENIMAQQKHNIFFVVLLLFRIVAVRSPALSLSDKN